MKKLRRKTLIILLLTTGLIAFSQSNALWKNKKCAVVLTYDDGLNIDLDKVIPSLDSFGFKGTFYIPGNSPTLDNRINDWRVAAKNGHELGNHTLFHPCNGVSKNRTWVKPDYDMDNYTMKRMVDEILTANNILKAIDGKDKRTFAYTCGDLYIGDSLIWNQISKNFVSARGVKSAMAKITDVKLYEIDSYMMMNKSGEDMIALVKQAMTNEALIVFLFHGVGGEHNINIELSEHNKLLRFLKENEKDIWVASFIEVSEYVKEYQKK